MARMVGHVTYLSAQALDEKFGRRLQFAGDIGWNFEKFLIGRSGEVVGRFKSPVEPDAPELVKAVEAELGKK